MFNVILALSMVLAVCHINDGQLIQGKYCRNEKDCPGPNARCQAIDQWYSKCTCDTGYVFDMSSQKCITAMTDFLGFCDRQEDCDLLQMHKLICTRGRCQCANGYVYNDILYVCEDIKVALKRKSDKRLVIYVWIGLGILFVAVISYLFTCNFGSPMTVWRIKKRNKQGGQTDVKMRPFTDESDDGLQVNDV